MEMITVGRIVRAHGLRGVVAMLSYSDDPTRLERVGRLFLETREPSGRAARVVGYRGACVLLQLEGIETRDEAESLRDVCVQARVEDLPALADGEHFVHDILGLEVYTPEGDVIGTVVEVMSLPANDVYVVDTGTKRVLVPAVTQIIASVDIRAGRMVITPPPGLLEL